MHLARMTLLRTRCIEQIILLSSDVHVSRCAGVAVCGRLRCEGIGVRVWDSLLGGAAVNGGAVCRRCVEKEAK